MTTNNTQPNQSKLSDIGQAVKYAGRGSPTETLDLTKFQERWLGGWALLHCNDFNMVLLHGNCDDSLNLASIASISMKEILPNLKTSGQLLCCMPFRRYAQPC